MNESRMNPLTMKKLRTCATGCRVRVVGQKCAYTIRARSERFLICTKPFNPKKTVLYFIIDLEKRIRGPESLIFGMGAETAEQCEAMLARLEKPESDVEKTEVSYRNHVALDVVEVLLPKAWA